MPHKAETTSSTDERNALIRARDEALRRYESALAEAKKAEAARQTALQEQAKASEVQRAAEERLQRALQAQSAARNARLAAESKEAEAKKQLSDFEAAMKSAKTSAPSTTTQGPPAAVSAKHRDDAFKEKNSTIFTQSKTLDTYLPIEQGSYLWDRQIGYGACYGYRVSGSFRPGYGPGTYHHARLQYFKDKISECRTQTYLLRMEEKITIFSEMASRLQEEEDIGMEMEKCTKELKLMSSTLDDNVQTLDIHSQTGIEKTRLYIKALLLSKKIEINSHQLAALQLLNRTHWACVKTQPLWPDKQTLKECVALKEQELSSLDSAATFCNTAIAKSTELKYSSQLDDYLSQLEAFDGRIKERIDNAEVKSKQYQNKLETTFVKKVPEFLSSYLITESPATYEGTPYYKQPSGVTTVGCTGFGVGTMLGAIVCVALTGGAAAPLLIPATAITAGSFAVGVAFGRKSAESEGSAFLNGLFGGISLGVTLGMIRKNQLKAIPSSTPESEANHWKAVSEERRAKAEKEEAEAKEKEQKARDTLESIKKSTAALHQSSIFSPPKPESEVTRCQKDAKCKLFRIKFEPGSRYSQRYSSFTVKDKQGNSIDENLLESFRKDVVQMNSFLICEEKSNGSLAPIHMPQHVMTNILNFLKKQYPTEHWRCSHFAKIAHGLFFNPTEFNVHNEFYVPKNQYPSPGDAVGLLTTSGDVVHFAIYLLPDVYISKFGQNKLAITSKYDMSKIYNTTDMVKLLPFTPEIRRQKEMSATHPGGYTLYGEDDYTPRPAISRSNPMLTPY